MKHRFIAVCAALVFSGCSVMEPALQQGITQVAIQPELARIQLRPFAEQANPIAITQICIAYGRSMDWRVKNGAWIQVFEWGEEAANKGNSDAQYHLGNFYAWGVGTPENPQMALRWYSRAAGQGHVAAEDAKRAMEGKPPVCKNLITNCRMF